MDILCPTKANGDLQEKIMAQSKKRRTKLILTWISIAASHSAETIKHPKDQNKKDSHHILRLTLN